MRHWHNRFHYKADTAEYLSETKDIKTYILTNLPRVVSDIENIHSREHKLCLLAELEYEYKTSSQEQDE